MITGLIDINQTEAYEIIEILEAKIDFGPGGANIRKIEQTTDIDSLIHNPFDFMPILPNTIYVGNNTIRANYEVNPHFGKQMCNAPSIVNWTRNHQHILGFDILDINATITCKIPGPLSIRGEYWRINGPDEDTCFEIRDYYLLVLEMPLGIAKRT